jgi:uncharacterized protein (UPF0276 family)
MVDNFIHFSPQQLLDALSGLPIALHIVRSRFLEKSLDELMQMGKYLRGWLTTLQPLYVSDHLTRFTTASGRQLPVLAELDYTSCYPQVKDRIIAWQELLDTPLLLENYASLTSLGEKQVDFFKMLTTERHINLLFDFSNAYIAELNQVCTVQSWSSLIQCARHFHVAGFRLEKSTHLAIDTHDVPIATEVLACIQRFVGVEQAKHDKTIVVEFDAKMDIAQCKQEVRRVKKLFRQSVPMCQYV